jgi:hypothetical protein
LGFDVQDLFVQVAVVHLNLLCCSLSPAPGAYHAKTEKDESHRVFRWSIEVADGEE